MGQVGGRLLGDGGKERPVGHGGEGRKRQSSSDEESPPRKKKITGTTHYCAAIHCHNSRKGNAGMSFFRFPIKEPERCAKWIQNLRRQDVKKQKDCRNLLLCPTHFEPEMFLRKDRSLLWNAIPTIFPGIPNPPPRVTSARRVLLRNTRPDGTEPSQDQTQNLFSPLPSANIPLPLPAPTPPHPQSPLPFIDDDDDDDLLLPPADPLPPLPSPPQQKFTGVNVSTQTSKDLCDNTPRKKRLRTLLAKSQKKLREKRLVVQKMKKEAEKSKSVEAVIKSMLPYLSQDEHSLVAAQMRLRVGKKKHYPLTFKAFAISLYYKSPSCYRFLQTRYKLPAKSTINLWLSKLRFQEGFCENLLKLLKIRVQRLPPSDRHCVLIADEISLKKSVDFCASTDKVFGVGKEESAAKEENFLNGAMVFMVAGLQAKWKQTVSYFFVKNAMPSDELVPVVKKTLDALAETGLSVHAFCSDQGSNFSAAAAALGISENSCTFKHDGKDIAVIADPPHVLKNTRNCLLKYDIHTPDGIVKWAHIVSMYEQDKKGNFRLCPKLREKHFSLRAYGAKMKVKWAVQVSLFILFFIA